MFFLFDQHVLGSVFSRKIKRGEWYNKATGEKTQWRPNDGSIAFRYVDGTVISTLYYNHLLPAATTVDQLMKEI